MAQEVTAYIAKDGSIHLKKEDADMIDRVLDLKSRINEFLDSIGAKDKEEQFFRLITKWEMFRIDSENSLPSPSKPEVRAEIVKKTEPPKVHKKKVGVVGIWSGNQASIKKEFGDLLDLNIYTPDEMNKLGGTKEFHKIFVMRRFVSHKHTDILRSIGQEPMMINGGMNELKSALSSYVGA